MPCSPNSNSLNPPRIPVIPVPGFGIPISPIQPPVPDFTFPENFPQSVLDLINSLTIQWQGGELAPELDDLSNTVLKAISSLFEKIAPFLSLYNFFQALLNLVVCIIDVLCAIPNPWAMISAVTRLFKTCIPPFLNLFPWFALIIMILSILLLLIALIEYIIARILQLIEALLRNLVLLGEGATLQNADSTAAAAIKIASLLCLMDNLMAIFSAVAVIMSIIDALARLAGGGICGPSNGCCDDDICPPFIRNNPDGIKGNLGSLVYYKQINPNYTTLNLFQRNESWQFYNQDSDLAYQFRDIITPQPNSSGQTGGIFWPQDISFSKDTEVRQAPYNVNLILKNFDPKPFVPSDTGGARDMKVNNCLVYIKPYIGVYDEDNNLDTGTNDLGTLSLVGGLVTESDGTPYIVNGSQATLETFIHSNASNSGLAPVVDDGYYVNEIEYTLNINHPSLISYNLITLGCAPEISNETAIINNTTDFRSVFDKAQTSLPDISGAQKCYSDAMAKIRADVSIENVAEQAAIIETCLRDLQNQAKKSYCAFFNAAVNPFTSTFAVEPDIQFITRPIKVEVNLRDAGGTDLGTNFQVDCDLSKLKGEVTFGEITEFSYDGYGQFLAYITSDVPGSGELRVSWDNNIFSEKLNQGNVNLPTSVQEKVVPYMFVGIVSTDPKPQRDASDTANSEV